MAETPRTQVEEPRFGVSIQPAADPVDRTIIARAPQITADPYMNAWSEIARDFAAGYGALKKAQVEADIPMGEQYYLESGVDGLFADGKDEQAAMAALVRNGELAEEHSVGTRIGFERASGRSAAYREREKLSATLTEMISGARELDPKTGLPKLATAQDIDDAITRIRSESYAKYTQDPNFAWFKNSPYAAEEYNKLMRAYTPELAAQFKEKARENLTEHRRAMLMDELVNQAANLGTKQTITMDEFNNLNDFVFNNVIIGGIPNPQQFMAQAFQVAGMKMMNDNPQADHVGLMEQFINRVNIYKDPKTGTKVQGLFWEKTKDSLRTEARQRESQNRIDRRDLIVARTNAEFAKGNDPTSLVGKALALVRKSQNEGQNKEVIISELMRLRTDATMAILNSGDKGLSAYVTEVYKTIINDFIDIVDGSVRADKFRDGAAADAALTFALTGDIDQAEKFSANILDPKVRIDVSEKILKVSQSKVPLIFKDPLVAAQIQEFNSTKRIGVVPGVRPLNQPIPRRTIANNAVNAETEYSWNEDKQALMATAIEIASNPDIPASERKSQISKAIAEMTAARRARQEIFNVEFGKLENIIAENEKTFQDSTGVILNAFGAGIIDANSRDALLAAEKVFKSNVQPDEQTVEKNVRFVFSETAKPFFKEEQVNDPYFNKKFVRSVKPVIGPPSATFEISSEGQNEVIAISNLVREELIKAYAENKTAEFSQKYGFNLPTDPTVLRSSTADLAIRAAISAATKKLIEKRRTEFKP